MNIVENILYQCRLAPPALAVGAPGTTFNVVSYGRLERFIHNVSRRALDFGLSRGQIVALFVMEPVLHATIILSLTRLGVVTVSGRNPKPPKGLRVSALITDTDYPYAATKIIRADSGWLMGDGEPIEERHIPQVSPDDICRIVLTSGTTGDAKAVALSHRMVAERIARHDIVLGSRLPQCLRTYCDLGLATSLGFQFLIYSLSRGGSMIFPGLSIEQNVRAFDLYNVQNMVSAPYGLARYLGFYQDRKSLQCKMEMILSAGSLLSPQLSDRVRARMCPNVVSLYGSTEASMIAVASAHVLAPIPGAVGHVLPDVTVQIVGDSGKVLPPGTEGTVRICSRYSPGEYVGIPAEEASAFAEEWFYPGDIGRVTPDNLLVITGRDKAVLNVGGDKLKPEMVEQVIASFPGIEQAAVFGIPNQLGIDELWSLVVVTGKLDEHALRLHCESIIPSNFVPSRFIVTERLPRNDMGKVERQHLPEIAKIKSG